MPAAISESIPRPKPHPAGRENSSTAIPIKTMASAVSSQAQSIQLLLNHRMPSPCAASWELQLVYVYRKKRITPRLRNPVTTSPRRSGAGKIHNQMIQTRLSSTTARSSGGKKARSGMTPCQAKLLLKNKIACASSSIARPNTSRPMYGCALIRRPMTAACRHDNMEKANTR